MISNESLKKQAYYYQETKNLFANERAQAKKHLYYATLRLKFLEWLERGYMDELTFKFDTPEYDNKSLEETVAWQEAVLMLGEEIREDDFYIDIVGNTNNYSITLRYHAPRTPEEEAKFKNLIKDIKKEHFRDKLSYKEREKLNKFFHGLMNMKSKESPIFHERYNEFKNMINEVATKGDTYQKVITKISKVGKNKKSLLEQFLAKSK